MDSPIEKQYSLPGSAEDVWQAFMEESELEKWLAGTSSEMDDRIGHSFHWHVRGREMRGRVIEEEYPRKIVFDWQRETWEEDQFARVELELSSASDPTYMNLTITNIPDSEWDEVFHDWDGTIMDRLEKYLREKKK